MLTGGTLYMDAFENLHAVWKWPSNHRKTISAFLIFVLPIQMDFAVILDTVPLPLNHLMWWRWLGSLICSSKLNFSDITLQGEKKPKQTTTAKKHHPTQKVPHVQRAWAHTGSKGRSAAVWLLQNARCDPVMIKAFLPGSALEQSREFCWVWMKKSDQKVLATESWHNG